MFKEKVERYMDYFVFQNIVKSIEDYLGMIYPNNINIIFLNGSDECGGAFGRFSSV
jgi:hypothetical protein